jgi:hypothetical protein
MYEINLSKVNEVMHLSMVFHCINDGLGNETMLKHGNICKKRAHE